MADSNNFFRTAGLSGLLKDGYKHFAGTDEAVLKNVDACRQLAQITRTSLGPNGMNKLVINHLDKLFVTSDTGTIVGELEVAHPAAKMVVMAAKMQEQEVGDGTNFVVSMAGELLSFADELLRQGVHISDIIAGYTQAGEMALRELQLLVVKTVENPRDAHELEAVLRPVLAAKQYGLEDALATFVTQACITVMPADRPSVHVDSVRVAKMLGAGVADSRVMRGMVLLREADGDIKRVRHAKVAVFGCGVQSASTETKGTVVIKDADELLTYNKGEEKMMEEAVRAIADSGANVVVSGGSISEMGAHFMNKYNLMFVKVTSKWDLRRLCRAVGATACSRLGAPTPEEMGRCDLVEVQEVGSRRVTVFRQDTEGSGLATIVLRGSTMNILDDLERAIDDGVNTVKTLCRDGRLVPGAGASELELASRIAQHGAACPGLEQYAIKKYAEALEVVPRTLAENAGQKATDAVSTLYAAHAAGSASAGINIEDGGVIDAAAAGILDLLATKHSAIKLATDAAVTVLRVDQIIMAKQAGGPKPPKPSAPDDD